MSDTAQLREVATRIVRYTQSQVYDTLACLETDDVPTFLHSVVPRLETVLEDLKQEMEAADGF